MTGKFAIFRPESTTRCSADGRTEGRKKRRKEERTLRETRGKDKQTETDRREIKISRVTFNVTELTPFSHFLCGRFAGREFLIARKIAYSTTRPRLKVDLGGCWLLWASRCSLRAPYGRHACFLAAEDRRPPSEFQAQRNVAPASTFDRDDDDDGITIDARELVYGYLRNSKSPAVNSAVHKLNSLYFRITRANARVQNPYNIYSPERGQL